MSHWYVEVTPPDFELRRALRHRQVGDVPAETISLEVLVEEIDPETDEPSGNYTGYIVSAHGWDRYGTFTYVPHRKRGMRWKDYIWFPRGRYKGRQPNVIINEWRK
jgi:hypothetical protein